MKRTSLLLTTLLLASAAHATNYSATTSSTIRDWEEMTWSPASPPPGSGDDVLDISQQSESTLSLYLAQSSRTLRSLGKTSGGNVRIYNGTNASAYDTTFTLTNTLSLKAGNYLFRSANTTTRLTVNVGNLQIGDTGATGQVSIGDQTANQNVTFTVSGTTLLTGSSPRLAIAGSSEANAKTYVNLGHVILRDTATSVGTAGISAGAAGVNVELKSLRTEGTVYAAAALSGAGTFLLTGMQADPLQPTGRNRYESNIVGAVSIRKTGDNVQVFARGRGASYTGGTEVGGGTLAISNARSNESALGTGAVTIRNGGTLAAEGTGIVRLGSGNTTTVESGGTLAPGALGDVGFARLAFNSAASGIAPALKMEAGAEFTFRLGPGGASDQIFLLGYAGASDLVLNHNVVNLTGTVGAGIYDLFVFKSNESANIDLDALSSIASGLTSGLATGSGFDGYLATFHYDNPLYGGIGTISLELTAVPEPAALLPALFAGGAWLLVRRRKQG